MKLVAVSSIVVAALTGLFGWSGRSAEPAEPQITINYPGRPGYEEEIFFAVLEGLYRDGVQHAVVDAIVAEDPKSGYPANLVYACPVCMPALRALHVYRARPKFYRDKTQRDAFGKGLPPELVTRLTSNDAADRQIAIRELIEDWIGKRLEAKRPTPEERAEWLDEMEKRRKEGMSYLESYRAAGISSAYDTMKACPVCDGAQGACKRVK